MAATCSKPCRSIAAACSELNRSKAAACSKRSRSKAAACSELNRSMTTFCRSTAISNSAIACAMSNRSSAFTASSLASTNGSVTAVVTRLPPNYSPTPRSGEHRRCPVSFANQSRSSPSIYQDRDRFTAAPKRSQGRVSKRSLCEQGCHHTNGGQMPCHNRSEQPIGSRGQAPLDGSDRLRHVQPELGLHGIILGVYQRLCYCCRHKTPSELLPDTEERRTPPLPRFLRESIQIVTINLPGPRSLHRRTEGIFLAL